MAVRGYSGEDHPQPQPAEPMQPGRNYGTRCGWLDSSWVSPYLPQPPGLTQPPYWQIAPPRNKGPWPKCQLGQRFPLQPGDAPTPLMGRFSRGHQSPNLWNLGEMGPEELQIEGRASPPSPATPPHWPATSPWIKHQPLELWLGRWSLC